MTDIEKKWHIVKYYVKDHIGKKTVHIYERDLDKAARNLGQTGKVLVDLLKKEIKEHNSKIYAAQTRIENLKYKDHKTYESALIKRNNVPFERIDAMIKKNPEADWYDLYKRLVGGN